MQFEFATAGSIRFGAGRLPEAGPAVRAWGRRVLVVGGKNADRSAALRRALSEQGVEWHLYSVAAEPTVEVVEAGVALARQAECEAVVAMGGGSVLDAGKAIAGLAPNPGHVLDYLEVVGRGQPLAQPGIPCLAVPTTAGTGAEVTRNA
ncbi:MAG TPA: iron-containing alcohol dehydrogenase, partial [Candidatus Paceibacterota bacterium]|nr:iron-containing alcohol dehydrogenase [Candidatus Paceibacterota bacterium]